MKSKALTICAIMLLAGFGFAQSKKDDKEEKPKKEPFQIRQITQGMGLQEIGPVSPDGKSVLLVAKKPDRSPNLYVMDLSGFSIRPPLTNFAWGVADPAWSPGGEAVALAGFNETASFSEIYVIEVGTGRARQLTRNNFSDKEPVFSRDGKRLFYTSDESPLPDAAFGILHVASIPVGGGKPEVFTEDEGSSIQPGITADGKAVLLIRVDELSGRHSLWQYGFDGKPQRSLTGRKLARIHRYLVEGDSIILWGQEETEQQEFVYILNVKSGEIQPLPDPDTPKRSPTVSPDGKLIAYVSPGPRGTYLFLYDRASGQITQLTTKGGQVFSPRFASNSSVIFGSHSREGGNEIYEINLTAATQEDKKDNKDNKDKK